MRKRDFEGIDAVEKPAIIYVRASTSEEKQRGSFSTQRERIYSWAFLNGYKVLSVLTEYKSASKRLERPQWNKALQALRDHPSLTLICYDVTRATRSLRDWDKIEDLVPRIRFTTNRDEPANKVMLGIMISIAMEESEKISRRVSHGIQRKKAEAERLGYKWSWGNDAKHMATPENAANGRKSNTSKAREHALLTVALLKSQYKDVGVARGGLTLREMADYLNDRGSTTRRGKSWTTSSLDRVIKYAEGIK